MNKGTMHSWEPAVRELCRAQDLRPWLEKGSGKFILCLLLIIIGGAIYGASLGIWRAPLQACFVAVKFPLLLLLTALGTALINGMLAQLLQAPIQFRQSLLAVLMSFALLAVMLASFTPLIGFLLWHLPPMSSKGQMDTHRIFLLANVAVIAFSGTVANLQLYYLLKQISGKSAGQILAVWLAMNLFLGAQLSWNLRPFVGTPALPVTFMRDDPFNGSFYEAVFLLVQRSML
ncbi:MAG: hypothetical protein Q3M24_17350 [Candidatus Electrothrix aestuarii]|uniref:Uncharacterized protein n=1 Tax=Candidatus Electrothrix aestuarii TaxID=3062594 RepID=A0AAU8LSF5_9BACT|nr:hypothetical protein [Candidatus Electrothrix aestuarii]